MGRSKSVLFLLGLLLLLVLSARSAQAEDADRFRPYLRFGSGDISANWGVYDMWTSSLGADFDKNWAGELGIDFYEQDLEENGRALGEVGALHVVPQLRLRQPFFNNRLVFYLLAGTGVSFLQFNDRMGPGFGRQIDIDGSTLTVTAGGGFDAFIADNVAINLEGKYFWLQPVSGTLDGRRTDVDLSAPTVSIGVRVFASENRPRPLAGAGENWSGRGYFGLRLGGAVLTDDRWVPKVQLEPEPSSFGTVNQTGGLLFGWDVGRNWGAELAVDSLEYRIHVDGIGQVGEYGMGVAIPQVRYRIPLDGDRWVPYCNAGMGLVYAEFNDRTVNGFGHDISAKGIYPACSVGIGGEYFLIRNLSLLADVGWLYSWNHGIEVDDIVNDRGAFSAVMFHLGFRIYPFERSR
jgi:opacity protein-like surface antigen